MVTLSQGLWMQIQANSSFLCKALRIETIMKQFIMNKKYIKSETRMTATKLAFYLVCCLKNVLALKICIVLPH